MSDGMGRSGRQARAWVQARSANLVRMEHDAPGTELPLVPSLQRAEAAEGRGGEADQPSTAGRPAGPKAAGQVRQTPTPGEIAARVYRMLQRDLLRARERRGGRY